MLAICGFICEVEMRRTWIVIALAGMLSSCLIGCNKPQPAPPGRVLTLSIASILRMPSRSTSCTRLSP